MNGVLHVAGGLGELALHVVGGRLNGLDGVVSGLLHLLGELLRLGFGSGLPGGLGLGGGLGGGLGRHEGGGLCAGARGLVWGSLV